MDVTISIRTGGTPSCITSPGMVKSSAFNPAAPKPNSSEVLLNFHEASSSSTRRLLRVLSGPLIASKKGSPLPRRNPAISPFCPPCVSLPPLKICFLKMRFHFAAQGLGQREPEVSAVRCTRLLDIKSWPAPPNDRPCTRACTAGLAPIRERRSSLADKKNTLDIGLDSLTQS